MESSEDQLERAERAINAFDPDVVERRWSFEWRGADGLAEQHEYRQAALGFFFTQELGILLTRIVKGAMAGKYGIDVSELIRDRGKLTAARDVVAHEHDPDETHKHSLAFARMTPEQVAEVAEMHGVGFEDPDKTTEAMRLAHAEVPIDVQSVYEQWKPYIDAFLRLMEELPDVQQQIIALSLGVRKRERDAFMEAISESTQYGGLSVDDGVTIIKTFIVQNTSVIRRFLAVQLQEIGAALMDALEVEQEADKKSEGSNGGTPSSTSSAPIQG